MKKVILKSGNYTYKNSTSEKPIQGLDMQKWLKDSLHYLGIAVNDPCCADEIVPGGVDSDTRLTNPHVSGNSLCFDLLNVKTNTVISTNVSCIPLEQININTSIAINNNILEYTDETGTKTSIPLCPIVKSCETKTTLEDFSLSGTTLTIKYKGEDGAIQTKTLNIGGILPVIDVHIQGVTYDPVNNRWVITQNDGSIFYLSWNDIIADTDFCPAVKSCETLTALTDNGNGTITYVDEKGNPTVIDICDVISHCTVAATSALLPIEEVFCDGTTANYCPTYQTCSPTISDFELVNPFTGDALSDASHLITSKTTLLNLLNNNTQKPTGTTYTDVVTVSGKCYIKLTTDLINHPPIQVRRFNCSIDTWVHSGSSNLNESITLGLQCKQVTNQTTNTTTSRGSLRLPLLNGTDYITPHITTDYPIIVDNTTHVQSLLSYQFNTYTTIGGVEYIPTYAELDSKYYFCDLATNTIKVVSKQDGSLITSFPTTNLPLGITTSGKAFYVLVYNGTNNIIRTFDLNYSEIDNVVVPDLLSASQVSSAIQYHDGWLYMNTTTPNNLVYYTTHYNINLNTFSLVVHPNTQPLFPTHTQSTMLGYPGVIGGKVYKMCGNQLWELNKGGATYLKTLPITNTEYLVTEGYCGNITTIADGGEVVIVDKDTHNVLYFYDLNVDCFNAITRCGTTTYYKNTAVTESSLVTKIVDNNDGTFTYTNEIGVQTTLSVCKMLNDSDCTPATNMVIFSNHDSPYTIGIRTVNNVGINSVNNTFGDGNGEMFYCNGNYYIGTYNGNYINKYDNHLNHILSIPAAVQVSIRDHINNMMDYDGKYIYTCGAAKFTIISPFTDTVIKDFIKADFTNDPLDVVFCTSCTTIKHHNYVYLSVYKEENTTGIKTQTIYKIDKTTFVKTVLASTTTSTFKFSLISPYEDAFEKWGGIHQLKTGEIYTLNCDIVGTTKSHSAVIIDNTTGVITQRPLTGIAPMVNPPVFGPYYFSRANGIDYLAFSGGNRNGEFLEIYASIDVQILTTITNLGTPYFVRAFNSTTSILSTDSLGYAIWFDNLTGANLGPISTGDCFCALPLYL